MYNQLKNILILFLAVCAISSYATENESGTKLSTTSSDRFESYNRSIYKINDTVDKVVIRPATVFYITYMPSPIRIVMQNFFNNLRDFVTLGNDAVQLNGKKVMHNLMRVAINSTFGVIGFIDISSSLDLQQNTNSFGKTMQVYGWTTSSYFIIPFIGPSTVRDGIGMIPDVFFNPTWWIGINDYVSNGLFVITALDQRAKYLDFDQLLEASIDPYATMRDTYLQAHGESIPQSASDDANSLSIDSIIDGEE